MKLIFLAILAISIFLNVFFFLNYLKPRVASTDVVQNNVPELSEKYPYLSQRILGEFDHDIIVHFVDLRTKLKSSVEKYGDNFAFYFEYLPTGTSIGVNEQIEYYSASLLKVPTVMAYYAHLENHSIEIEPVFTINKDNVDARFGTLWKRGVGAKVTGDEAVKYALAESDNTAVSLIKEEVGQHDYVSIYDGLDVTVSVDEEKLMASITPEAYSSILKALFFSAVISKENSNKVLKYLAQSKFQDKLPAVIPDNVEVAHKIGVFEDVDPHIYADCGIVYIPRRQYLLCMFSRSSEGEAVARMHSVSKTIYDYVATLEIPQPTKH